MDKKVGRDSNETKQKISLKKQGEKNNTSILSKNDVIKIRELFDSGKFTKKQLSDMFNVKPPAIYKIVKKLTWNYNETYTEI